MSRLLRADEQRIVFGVSPGERAKSQAICRGFAGVAIALGGGMHFRRHNLRVSQQQTGRLGRHYPCPFRPDELWALHRGERRGQAEILRLAREAAGWQRLPGEGWRAGGSGKPAWRGAAPA